MPSNPVELEAEAQQVLDELWSEKLIPFALNIGKITRASYEYTIHFHDSRIHTASVPVIDGHSFKEMVRSAVLDRVARISGPLSAPRKTEER
jgi:hypothetical protein